MSRFRYDGVAWDGQPFHVVPCLRVLGDQITEFDPTRYPVDGTVASRAHDAGSPNSDHSPDSNDKVRGLDAGGREAELDAMVEALRLSRDERILYVIYEGRMFSSYAARGYDPFMWRPYTGWSPHEDHFHMSTREEFDDDVRNWSITNMADHTHPVIPDLTTPGKVFHESWKWAEDLRIVNADTEPTDVVEKQEMIAFLERYDLAVQAELADLQNQINSLKDGTCKCRVEVFVNGEPLV